MERRVDLRKIIDLAQMKFLDLKKLLQGTKDKKVRKVISGHIRLRRTIHADMITQYKRRNRNRRRNKIALISRRINR